MTTPTLVSIVIPAYNHGNYVAEAIRSVLAQDYPSVELIVIDDGSSDDTAQVLGAMDGFYWESQANAGQARTLEKGWRIARGDILGYLSADDTLEPNAVAEAVASLTKHPDTVVVYPDYALIDPQSRVVRHVESPEYSYRDMLVDVVCAPGPGAFFRRVAYEKAGPWNPTYRQMPDYDFWLRMGLHGAFLRVPQRLAAFRVHEGSQTYALATPERAAEPVRIVERILSDPAMAPDLKAMGSEALANAHLISAQLHLRAGRIDSAMASLMAACKLKSSAVFSLRSMRLLANAIFNRLGHRVLWLLRRS